VRVHRKKVVGVLYTDPMAETTNLVHVGPGSVDNTVAGRENREIVARVIYAPMFTPYLAGNRVDSGTVTA